MRKAVSVLGMLLLAVSAAFTADSNPVYTWSSGSVSGKADVKVSVNTETTQKCVVGFTNTNPKQDASDFTVNSQVGDSSKDIILNIDETNGMASNEDTDLYLYYQIASNENIVIKLYEEKELTGALTPNADTVKWQVITEGDIDDLSGNEIGDSNAALIYEHEPTTKTWGAADSIKLDIGTTESLWDKKADNYTSNLIVAISVDSHKE